MLTGGISLAIGATVSLGAVIAATTMTGPLGVAGGIAAVALAGLVIGAADRADRRPLRLPAIIVTLAGSFIIGGVALLILPRPGGAVPVWLSDLLAGNTPTAFVLLVVIVLLLEALSGDAARPQPLRRRREPGRRLSLRRAGRRGAHRRLCDQRPACDLRRPLRRRADRARAIR